MRRAIVFVLAVLTLLSTSPEVLTGAHAAIRAATPTEPPQQPGQPATGPGGAELTYDGLRAQHFGPWPDGTQAPTGYWLFEPIGPHAGVTGTELLPLVIFFHAFDAVDPELYHVWIDHLVRRGAVLVFPDFQTANLPFDDPTISALHQSAPGYIQAAVQAALAELASGSHVRPNLSRVAVIGHSSGATLAADYTGSAPDAGLPVPAALLLAMPGCPSICELSALGGIPASTRILVLVGNQDTLAGEETAKRIWISLGQVPPNHKDYVRLIGDDHGQPPTVADHFVALTAGFAQAYVDTLDWYGTWKWADALMSCSFAGDDCDIALGNTAQQRYMGTWSDGVPVAEPQVTQDPGPPVAATPSA